MEIAGLPAHALVVHGAVVFGPLAAIAAIAFALVPRWRWALRWPSLGLSVLAVVFGIAAYLSGNDYLDANQGLQQSPAVQTHQDRAEILIWVIVAFGLVAIASTFVLGGPTALATGRGERATGSVGLERVLKALLVIVAALMLVYVVLVGDAGSRSKWG